MDSSELKRLSELRSYQVLDTAPEEAYDEMVRLAATICETPISMISLVDEHRQWFKASIGMVTRETPLDMSICRLAVRQKTLFEVPDIALDARIAGIPNRIGISNLRFYAGMPLITPCGYVIGTLCVLDTKPRELTSAQRSALEVLSKQVVRELEHRRALKQKVRAEAIVRCQMDAAIDGILLVSPEGKVLSFNKRFVSLWGISPAMLSNAEVEMVASLMLRRLRNPEQLLRYSRIGHKSAEKIHDELELVDGRVLERFSAPVIAGESVLLGRVWYFRDTTEKRKASLALKRALLEQKFARAQVAERERRQKEFFSRLPALVASTGGREHVFEFINETYQRLVGGRTLIGLPLRKALPELDEEVHRIRDKVYESGEGLVARDHLVRADWQANGKITEKYFTLIYEPRRDLSGNVDGVTCIAFDVTDSQRLATRLAHAEHMASIGTLAAGIAHEINNPLAFVMTNLELLSDRIADPGSETASLMEDARIGLERIRRIVKDMKLFCRIGEGASDSSSIHSVLESSLSMALNEIRHRAQVVLDYDPSVDHVVGNEGELCRVFLNLLINAAQAIPEGNATQNVIHLRTERLDSRVRIQVQDSGCGIPRERLHKVFDPFYTTKPPGEGTGLGLALSHGIITQLGGEIYVESTLGAGSTISVILPSAEPALQPKVPGPEPAPNLGSRPRVLILDDEAALATGMERLLKRDCDVTVSLHASSALTLVQEQEFDAIFCDLMMPDMTGMEFFNQVKTLMPGLEERIVFVTGGAFTSGAKAFLADVSNERLEKPFTGVALRGKLAQVCSSRTMD